MPFFKFDPEAKLRDGSFKIPKLSFLRLSGREKLSFGSIRSLASGSLLLAFMALMLGVPLAGQASHGFVHFFPLYYVGFAPTVPNEVIGTVKAVMISSAGADWTGEADILGNLFMSDLLGENMSDNVFPKVTVRIILKPETVIPKRLSLVLDLYADGKMCDPPTSKIWCKRFTGWMSGIDRLRKIAEKLTFVIDMKKLPVKTNEKKERFIEYALPVEALQDLKGQRANIQRAITRWRFKGFDEGGKELFSVLRGSPLGRSRKKGS